MLKNKIYNLFNKIKNKKKVNIATDEKVLPEDAIVITNNDGWVFCELSHLKTIKSFKLAYSALLSDEKNWINELTDEWFRSIRYYTTSNLLQYVLSLREKKIAEDSDSVINIKRSITISSIIFGFNIPNYLFYFDSIVMLNIIKYVIVTEKIRVNIEDVNPITYVKVIHLNKCINELSNNPVFRNRLDTIHMVNTLPNFIDFLALVKTVIRNDDEGSYLINLNPIQFKKVLTCLFIFSGLSVPRDYLYIDTEVIDWVNKGTDYSTKPAVDSYLKEYNSKVVASEYLSKYTKGKKTI